jgi:hypothetical protein
MTKNRKPPISPSCLSRPAMAEPYTSGAAPESTAARIPKLQMGFEHEGDLPKSNDGETLGL